MSKFGMLVEVGIWRYYRYM